MKKTPLHSRSRHLDGKGREWELDVEWESTAGRAEPVGIRIAQPHRERVLLTAALLRSLPLGTWISEARTQRADASRVAGRRIYDSSTPERQRDVEAIVEKLWGPHRGHGYSRAELEHVAAVYNEARERGVPVTAAVAKACNIAKNTAGKRIMAARRAGLLPEVKR